MHFTKNIKFYFNNKWIRFKILIMTFFYNDHLCSSYISDILMEPILWFVDNFSQFLGPFFVFAVVCLTLSVVIICYIVGLPYWWERNFVATIGLVIIGNWLLANIIFHYYMGCAVSPGLPPKGSLITEAVSMCKKCIAPKPPRTHHCSVCNKCILKMDHHCPWLNNCVGFWNHRHFFLYMVFTTLGVGFIMIFGFDLFIEHVWLFEEELEGHPIRMNNSVLIPITELPVESVDQKYGRWQRGAILYVSFLCVGVFITLGALSLWHARLITRGETSIEAHINKTETSRYALLGHTYVNPYNLGWRRNWSILLGTEDLSPTMTALRILLPSSHIINGNGLTWTSTFSDAENVTLNKAK